MRLLTLPRLLCPLGRLATLTIALAISLLIAPPADAQTTAKKALIGLLGLTPQVQANQETFKQGLAQLGQTEGQQVNFTQHDASGEPARLAAVAAELIQRKPRQSQKGR